MISTRLWTPKSEPLSFILYIYRVAENEELQTSLETLDGALAILESRQGLGWLVGSGLDLELLLFAERPQIVPSLP